MLYIWTYWCERIRSLFISNLETVGSPNFNVSTQESAAFNLYPSFGIGKEGSQERDIFWQRWRWSEWTLIFFRFPQQTEVMQKREGWERRGAGFTSSNEKTEEGSELYNFWSSENWNTCHNKQTILSSSWSACTELKTLKLQEPQPYAPFQTGYRKLLFAF